MRKLLIIFTILIVSSCSPELPDTKSLVDEIYQQKVAAYNRRKMRECRADAISDAEAHVDSIVYQLLNTDLTDSLEFPAKPVRPKAPEHIIGTVQKFDPQIGQD